MRCDVLTLFPGMVSPVLQESILKRAQKRGLLDVRVHSLRLFAEGKHHVTDDVPYGGGPGQVMKPEPIFAAVVAITKSCGRVRIILPSPRGIPFNRAMAKSFAEEDRSLLFICGHYEGIDARVQRGLEAEEVSVGDYILTGGELAALIMIDASARLIPGVLGKDASLNEESFEASLLEYPQYTRPRVFQKMEVPEVLVSGNHRAIAKWRREQSILCTLRNRPDMLRRATLTAREQERVMGGVNE